MRLIDGDRVSEKITETCDVIDHIRPEIGYIKICHMKQFFLKLKEFVDKQSEVDSETLRPHGKWIEPEGISYYGYDYVCTQCGYIEGYKRNYCPDCGAKMDLEEKKANETKN